LQAGHAEQASVLPSKLSEKGIEAGSPQREITKVDKDARDRFDLSVNSSYPAKTRQGIQQWLSRKGWRFQSSKNEETEKSVVLMVWVPSSEVHDATRAILAEAHRISTRQNKIIVTSEFDREAGAADVAFPTVDRPAESDLNKQELDERPIQLPEPEKYYRLRLVIQPIRPDLK